MIPILTPLHAYLDSLRPGLFNALLALVIFGAIYVVRKFWPDFFLKLPPKLQGFPALVIGALMSALSTPTDGVVDTVIASLEQALAGLLSGVLAIGLHHALKEAPGPYQGAAVPKEENRKTIPPGGPVAGSGFIALVLMLLSGCAGSFESAKVAGRAELKLAAPSPPTAECVSLDSAHRDWSAVGLGAGALAGASGLASIPDYDSKELRLGLAAGTVVMGALTVFAVKEADGFAESWARNCQ